MTPDDRAPRPEPTPSRSSSDSIDSAMQAQEIPEWLSRNSEAEARASERGRDGGARRRRSELDLGQGSCEVDEAGHATCASSTKAHGVGSGHGQGARGTHDAEEGCPERSRRASTTSAMADDDTAGSASLEGAAPACALDRRSAFEGSGSRSTRSTGSPSPTPSNCDTHSRASSAVATSPDPVRHQHDFSSASSNSSATSSSSNGGFASSSASSSGGFSSAASASSVTSASSTTTFSVSSHAERGRGKSHEGSQDSYRSDGSGLGAGKGTSSNEGKAARRPSSQSLFVRDESDEHDFVSGLGLNHFPTTSPIISPNGSLLGSAPDRRPSPRALSPSPTMYPTHSPTSFLPARGGDGSLDTLQPRLSELTLSPPALTPPGSPTPGPSSSSCAREDSSATVVDASAGLLDTPRSASTSASTSAPDSPTMSPSRSTGQASSSSTSRGKGKGKAPSSETSDGGFSSSDVDSDLLDDGAVIVTDNFAVVAEGVYRSSFPRTKNFEFLKTLGLKTVLTLVQEEYPEENLTFLREQGISFYQFSLPANKDPFVRIPDEKIVGAMEVLLDKRNHPLLVHCNKGKHRTGCLIGCLRRVLAWERDKISEEYVKYSHPKSRDMDIRFIEGFPGLDKIRTAVSPNRMYLPDWARDCLDATTSDSKDAAEPCERDVAEALDEVDELERERHGLADDEDRGGGDGREGDGTGGGRASMDTITVARKDRTSAANGR
ncbi:hypothetical protein JCM10212_004980 [Sporobolomyces blumeae]